MIDIEELKIGNFVICTSMDEWQEEHLTIGKKYQIVDIDPRFPDTIVLDSDNGKISMFFNIKNFNDVSYMREIKINKILNI